MKKLLLLAIVVFGLSASSKAGIISTNVLATVSRQPAFLLLPSRASVYQVQLTATTDSVIVNMYDSDVLANPHFGTNYTNGAYVQVSQYTTNQLGTFVGYNGYTNYTTNTGTFTYTNLFAGGTNVLPLMGTFAVGANQSIVYQVDQLHSRGITITANTNVGVSIWYKTGQ